MNEVSKVFFCPVGTTDPMGNGYDGPMLHIIRYYQPEVVYLFLTAELTIDEEQDGRYSRSVKRLLPTCELHLLKRPQLTDPSDFDVFIGEYKSILDDLYRQYPEATIITNNSSGTPQMIMALALDSVNHPACIEAVQVTTPTMRGNRFEKKQKFDLEEVLGNNLDDLTDAICRCKKLEYNIVRKNNIANDIRALVQNYEYHGAIVMLGKNEQLFSSDLKGLLKYANYRERMQLSCGEKYLPEAYKNKFSEKHELLEFLRIMIIQKRQNRLADFFIKLGVLCKEMSCCYLENVCKLQVTKKSSGNIVGYDELKIQKAYPQLYEALIQNKRSFFSDKVVHVNLSRNLAIFEAAKQVGKMDEADYNLFSYFRFLEEKVRNSVAHEIDAVRIDLINKEIMSKYRNPEMQKAWGQYTPGCKLDMDLLCKNLRYIACKFINVKESKYRFVYDDINKEIEKLL